MLDKRTVPRRPSLRSADGTLTARKVPRVQRHCFGAACAASENQTPAASCRSCTILQGAIYAPSFRYRESASSPYSSECVSKCTREAEQLPWIIHDRAISCSARGTFLPSLGFDSDAPQFNANSGSENLSVVKGFSHWHLDCSSPARQVVLLWWKGTMRPNAACGHAEAAQAIGCVPYATLPRKHSSQFRAPSRGAIIARTVVRSPRHPLHSFDQRSRWPGPSSAAREAQATVMEIDYLTIQETAVRARMASKTLYNWISLGRIGVAEGVCHVGRTGRKVLIHWPTFEATVLQGNLRGAA